MRLTRRGEIFAGITFLIGFTLLMGFVGWLENLGM